MERLKTVADIWNEVRDEQVRFNKALRYLFSALIVAFLIAAIAAYLSFTSLNRVSADIQQRIDVATAEAAVAASETKNRNETLLVETLKIREEVAEQRQSAGLVRDVDRTLAAYTFQRQRVTMDDLARQAVKIAEEAAKGKNLNSSTAYLVEIFLSENPALADSGPASELEDNDQRRLINMVHADWLARGRPDRDEVGKAWQQLTIDSQSERSKGLALAGLGLFHYRRAEESQNSLKWDKGCKDAVQFIRQANERGIQSDLLSLAQGECLRKNGYKDEALNAFIEALELQESQTDASLDQRRRAAHGAGTTLIAVQVAALENAAIKKKLDESLAELRKLKPETLGEDQTNDTCPKVSDVDREALRDACLLLEYAAELRGKRGESEIGKIYTRENIGFIHLLSGDWQAAEKHAREIDEELAAAWNLTVLVIALEEQKKTEKDKARLARLERDLAVATRKLSLLDRDSLDGEEIRKLLESRHEPQIAEIEKKMRGT